jgi:hypothetical protein
MKKVFSNSDLVHTFAQRSQSEGRTSAGGMFFRDDKIYSYGYHYLLGEFIDDKTIIINDRGYSSSTGKHIGMLTSATRQYRQLFMTDIDIKLVSWRIKENEEKLKNARKPEIYVNEIISSFETLESYLVEFKQVNIIKSDEFKSIKKIYKALYKDKDKYLEQAKARGIKEKEQAKKLLAEQLIKFYNFEIDRIYGKKVDEDFLRVSQDRTQVETTQGVRIDIEDARHLYKLIKAGKDVAGERIGVYRVSSLNGHLVVGCHRINKKNVKEVGEKILLNK